MRNKCIFEGSGAEPYVYTETDLLLNRLKAHRLYLIFYICSFSSVDLSVNVLPFLEIDLFIDDSRAFID